MADKPRVLVVEDDETLRVLVRRQLRTLGFEVTLAENGAIACQRHAESEFAMILMDLQMPEKDGFEATREIRANEEKLSHKRCIIIAMAASQEHKRALDSGMDDFLLKPFMVETLQAMVAKWLPAHANA